MNDKIHKYLYIGVCCTTLGITLILLSLFL